jgi:pimeloyl-ACP methyl ester carboxylesterase
MRNSSIVSAQFKHRVEFIEQAINTTAVQSETRNRKLVVFIEGDGTPWFREKYVSKDPTPHTLLMHAAMQDVHGSKLYLGRPCYFQTQDTHCHYRYWTSHRYSSEVVSSMQDVLENYLANYEDIVFVGHSGGGSLAALLSCQMPAAHIKSRTLITLSANLDSDKWTDHHGWSRMEGSLNPADSLTSCPGLRQYHYVGGKDENVPYFLNQQFYDQHDITPIVYKEAAHADWLTFWPDIVDSNPALRASDAH